MSERPVQERTMRRSLHRLERWLRRAWERRRRHRRPNRSSVVPRRVEGDQHLPDNPASSPPPLSFFTMSPWSCRPAVGCASSAKSTTSTAEDAVRPARPRDDPVDRDNPRGALGALEQAADVLRADELFAIYPEGTRSRDGSLQAGHPALDSSAWTLGCRSCRPGSSAPTASSHPAHAFHGHSDRPSSASAPRSIQRAIGGTVANAGDASPAT